MCVNYKQLIFIYLFVRGRKGSFPCTALYRPSPSKSGGRNGFQTTVFRVITLSPLKSQIMSRFSVKILIFYAEII